MNFQMLKLVLEKANEPEIKLPTSTGSSKKQHISRKISTSALLTMPRPFTGHGTTHWFQIGKGVRQGCILLPCLFNLYEEYIMRNAGLNESQAGIKISMRNINVRYVYDNTIMGESEEELKKTSRWK